jgi:REP element-mobilizing transposase RayT
MKAPLRTRNPRNRKRGGRDAPARPAKPPALPRNSGTGLADKVASALCHFDGQRYRLFAWCIMPNHVHVVVRILPNWTPASILHSWKSFTAKRANQVLRSHEAFWQREYYDHLIRDEGEFVRSIRYVAENPAKARLENWPWVWVCGRDAPTTAGEDAGATKP